MKKVKVLAYLTLCCLFFNSVMADEMEPGYVNDSYISTDIVENDNNDLYIDDDEEQENDPIILIFATTRKQYRLSACPERGP